MASENADQHNQRQAVFKCRRCRHFLFSGANVLPSAHPDHDAIQTAIRGNTALNLPPSSRQAQHRIDRVLWYINNDARPPWIQSAIEEAQWTRGKLACPRCRGRLGSFDFLTPSIRHRQDRQQAWTCVQIIGSRVDHESSHSVLENLRSGNRLQVKGHTVLDSPESILKADSLMSAGNSEGGTLPEGCWYVNGEEVEAKRSSSQHADSNTDLILGVSTDKQTRNNFGKDQQESLTVATGQSKCGSPLQSSEFTMSSDVNTPKTCDNCKVPPRVPADQLSLRTTVVKGDASTSKNPLGCNHAGQEPSDKYAGPSENRPTHTHSVDETIQFGFCNALRNEPPRKCEDTEHALSDTSVGNNSEAGMVSDSMTTANSMNSALPNLQVQPSPCHSVSSDSQDLDSSHATMQIQDSPHQPLNHRCSDEEDSESEQSLSIPRGALVDGSSSPEQWQGFLDELLVELDRERGGAPLSTWRGHNNINQLEDEMDTESHQNDVARTPQSISDSQGMSAYLQRAVLRAQRKERNKRKSERRKLRRRERWKEERSAEELELLEEEQNLDCDPQKILTLLGTHQSGASIREVLTCPVCLDLYLNPHLCLPCLHTFCEPCLRRLANTRQTSVTTPCPLCRTIIQDAKPQDELTAAIEELFPQLIAHRKQAERKTLSKSYPLPGHTAPPSLTSWINGTLAGRSRRGQHYSRWRGRQERATVGLIINMAWRLGAVIVLVIGLMGLCGAFLLIMMNYS